MAGLTALRTVRILGSVLGRRIVVTGASGGVGRLQVQLARISGAEVIASTRSGPVPSATRTVTDLRDIPIVDGILESVGGSTLTDALAKLRPGAPLVWFGSTSGDTASLSIYDFAGHEQVSIHTYLSYAADIGKDAEDLNTLLRLVGSGDLSPHISARLPLDQAATGVRQLRNGGVRGKIILASQSPSSSHRGEA
jgi:NADPH2:quinone reductase